MTLTKNDLKQIGNIVQEKVGTGIEELATMTKRGFDAQDDHFKSQDKRFDAIEEHLTRQDKKIDQLSKVVANLEFIATEMVRRDEFLEVKNRLSQIEAKLGLAK